MDKPTLLLTRPEEDSLNMAADLRSMGYNAITSPLMQIEYIKDHDADFSYYSGVVATSRHALKTVRGTSIPVFCAGPGTGQIAHARGFYNIYESETGKSGIPALIKDAELSGTLLYLCGEHTSTGTKALLRSTGLHVDCVITYSNALMLDFTQRALNAFRNQEIDGVVLMSERTAENYRDLVSGHDLTDKVQHIKHVCISKAVADKANMPVTHVADHPNLDSVYKKLGHIYGGNA